MENLLIDQPLSLTPVEIFSNLLISVFLGLIVALIYKNTHKSTSYSQSYVLSLVLLTVIATMVIMIIGNSLVRAFGLIGAFTIIRFRTAIKDVRDLTFMFFSLSLGLAAGIGAYFIAAAGLLVVGFLMIALDKFRFGSIFQYEYLLNFTIKSDAKPSHDQIFKQFLNDNLLLNARPIKGGEQLELSYNIRLKNHNSLTEFTKSLSKLKYISRIELLSMKTDVEY